MSPGERDPVAAQNEINWDLLQLLAQQPHKHLNIAEGVVYGVLVDGRFDSSNQGIGEVMTEARTVQHLCDLAGVPEGWSSDAHIDARVYQLALEVLQLRVRLDRISTRHARETLAGGMVLDFCVECEQRWPCDTYSLAVDGEVPEDTTVVDG